MDSEPRFFDLGCEKDGPHDADIGSELPIRNGNARRCPQCGEYIGKLELLPPIRMELEVYGASPGDFLMTPGGDAVVSERFADAFRQENLVGAEDFKQIEIVKAVRRLAGPRLGKLPRYFLMKVCFARVAVDETRSLLRRTDPIDCPECRATGLDGIYGYKLEREGWRGEDIFHPRGLLSHFVVSERFTKFVKDHAITNTRLLPTEQVWWDPRRKGRPAPPALA